MKITVFLSENMILIEESLQVDRSKIDNQMVAYIALRMIMRENINKYYIDFRSLTYMLYDNINESDSTALNVNAGIKMLIKNNNIKSLHNNKYARELDLSPIYLSKTDTDKKFTMVESDEIRKILSLRYKNKIGLLRYFLVVVGTLSSQITVNPFSCSSKTRVVGKMTIDQLAKMSGIVKTTALNFNKILEKNQLLYIHRQDDFTVDKKKLIKSLPNVYGRYKDKPYIIKHAEDERRFHQSYKLIKSTKGKSNNSRKLSQMYNTLLAGGGTNYTQEQLREIYDYKHLQNLKYEKLYEKSNDEDFLEKIKDLSIFDEYGFTGDENTP